MQNNGVILVWRVAPQAQELKEKANRLVCITQELMNNEEQWMGLVIKAISKKYGL